jgi:hypothetical protein
VKTINVRKLSLVCLFFSLLAGCLSKEKVYEGVYEGLKQREQIVNPVDPSREAGRQKLPGYDAYKRDREKALEENNKK